MVVSEDQVFHGRAERFRDRIYGNAKGQLRLELVWRDLYEQVLEQRDVSALRAWDAGGGLGQMSERLAGEGCELVFSEPAADMLAVARSVLPESVTCNPQTIQQHVLTGSHGPGYDLILCHAVLEWLAEPQQTLQTLLQALRPGGVLSLLFYNVHAIALANMVKGNLYKVAQENFAGAPGSFTPPSPLKPHEVVSWLELEGLEVIGRRSVRLAHDLMSRQLRAERSLEDVMALEWQYGNREPYWQLGRYVHVIAQKPVA